jgi:cyclophilin family peptidyl-prolyl cis-trans isomerase
MDVVDTISEVDTDPNDKPREPVTIERVEVSD